MRDLIRRTKLDRAARYALLYLNVRMDRLDGLDPWETRLNPERPNMQIALLVDDVNRSIRAAGEQTTISHATREPSRLVRRKEES